MRMVAVVLGGGVGQRLGAGIPKQLLTLGGWAVPWDSAQVIPPPPGAMPAPGGAPAAGP